jgi:putative membrane protein
MKKTIASPIAASLVALFLGLSAGAHAADPAADTSAVQALQGDRTLVAQAAARENDPESAAMGRDAPAQLGKADRAFMTKAAGAGLYEVEVSKLAATRAASPAVKSFAEMMVADHAKANAELKQVASAHNYPLPDVPPGDKQAIIDRMSKLSGAEFDKAYRDQVGLKDHKADINLFESASRSTRNTALKGFVDKTLPTLNSHLKQAKDLQLGGKSG